MAKVQAKGVTTVARTKYRVVTTDPNPIWFDTDTGESFGVSETRAYRAYQAWVAAGGVPDAAPTRPAPPATRSERIATLAATARTAVAAAPLSTAGERALGAIFLGVIDALVTVVSETS